MSTDMSDIANSKKPAVILVPHAGGDRLSYSRLMSGLSKDGDVYLFEMAGHGKRADEGFSESYEEVLGELIEFIRDVAERHEKYMICGDSFGAFLCDNAYERLEREDDKLPSHVVYAAVDPARTSGEYDIEKVIEKSADSDLLNADNAYSRYLKDILEKDIELLKNGDAAFRARLKCPMSFFMGKEDMLLGKVDHNWSELAPCGYREYLFEGGHLFMTSNSNVINTLKTIRDRIQG